MLSNSWHESYRVNRYYRDRPAKYRTRKFRQDLTLAEARALVESSLGSSETDTSQLGKWHTRTYGRWFLGYERQ